MSQRVQTQFPRRHFSITASDATKFHKPTTVYVGVTGNVAVKDWETGTSITYVAVPAGSVVPVLVEQVLSTGTTATSLVGIY